MRDDLVDVIEPMMSGLRAWLDAPCKDWSFPASRAGPNSPACGRTLCKLKLVQAIRCATQVATRALDMDNAELLPIAHEPRYPHESRASAQTTAHRSARGSPDAQQSSDF